MDEPSNASAAAAAAASTPASASASIVPYNPRARSLRTRSLRKCQHVLWSWSTFCVFVVVCLMNPVLPEVIYRVDPLALLAATLRTYQRAGCDSEQLSLSCPRGTSISIELAQYGRAGDLSDHSLCPPVSQEDLTTTGSASDVVVHSGTEIEVKPPETCTVSGLQYALLQTVVDACQKKRHCKFAANSKTHSSGDPCSGIRKFVEIAYKCRPYEFRSKTACENDNMPLVCNPYSRIAIYSATFGHTERESVQCGHGNAPVSNEDSSKPTCLVSYATETVMQICHGRRRCSVTADAGTFGRPCNSDVHMYLKVVYTCIPRKVLKDRYETAPEADEPQQTELDMDQNELYDDDQFDKESEGVPPAPKLQGAVPNPGLPFDFGMANGEDSASSTRLPPLLSQNDNSLEENQEQFYLYLIISVGVGVLLCLTLVIGRLTLQKRRSSSKTSSPNGNMSSKGFSDTASAASVVGGTNRKFKQTTAGDHHLPESFGDEISDIDTDIDLASPMPLSSLSARNETYMTYAPTTSCTYGSLPAPGAYTSTAATTVLMPPNQHGSLLLAGHGGSGMGAKPMLGSSIGTGPVAVGASRQPTPPPATIYTSMGVCSPAVSGPMTMGPHMLAPSSLSTMSHHSSGTPSYLSGAMMYPGAHHPHTGTLRRTLIPTSMGLMNAPSPPPPSTALPPHSLTGVPSASSVYYDSTMPRNLTRGVSADSTQYFFG